jgi:YidC/Oxa1 family membrane protein insertase
MDRKSIIILVLSFVLLMLWYPLMNKLYPPKPLPPRTNSVATATNELAQGTNPPSVAASTSLPTPAAPVALPVPPGTSEQTLVLSNDHARYIFTSLGGGLKIVELVRYPEAVSCQRKQAANKLASLNAAAPLPALVLRGGPAVEGDGVFQLSPMAGGVRAEKALSHGLYLVKEFLPGSNYLLHATARLENRSAQPLALPAQEWVVGTATPMGPLDNEQWLGVYWYNGLKAEHVDASWFANRTLGCIPGRPRTQFLAGLNNVVWAAVHNQFFALAVVPSTNAPASQLVVNRIDLPTPSREELAANPKAITKPFGFQTSLIYPALTLPPGEKVEKQFSLFAGPKEYNTLAKLAGQFGNNLDLVLGFDDRFGGRFTGFFAKALLLTMNGLHRLLNLGYGWTIILITIVIKLLFWPLTQASTRSMKRMQALQPQMKAIQEKYKDDPPKLNRKLMEFMKEHKVNPMGGCLPMLIQIPVFLGFYGMIQSAIELRGARFLWACDLSNPDTLFIIPVVNFPFNPLPLLMGATMLWQARLTPVSPGMDPVQQKIMKYMPLMFLFILYNFSAGLTLYWTVQNLLTIAQMKLTRAKDESAVAPKMLVPATPPKKQK